MSAILVVSPYRAEYGPSRVLEHVLRALAEAGYRPVCAVPPGARLTEETLRIAAELHEVPELSTFPRTLAVGRLGRFFLHHLDAGHALEEIVRSTGAVAVYSVSEAIFAAGLAARRSGVPSVLHAIGMSIGSPAWSARLYIGFLDRLTDRFVAVSSAVADMFAANGVADEKITVVHNGIDVDEIERAPRGGSPVPEDAPRVGMFAAYDSRKGHELFVEAMAIVARERPDARFYLVGGVLADQRESVRFERRIADQIERLGLAERFERPGYVEPPAVYDWMRAMDVVVAPSRTEAFAHALLEAMACGRPVVASAVEGNLDAFVDGHSGVYTHRAPEAAAAAVLDLLDDPERARAIGEAARRRVELFGLDVTVAAIAQAVEPVAGPPSPLERGERVVG